MDMPGQVIATPLDICVTAQPKPIDGHLKQSEAFKVSEKIMDFHI